MIKNRRLILTIEDEEMVRRAIRRTLSRSGYEVLEASEGNSGIDAAKSNPVDLILLDMRMPCLARFALRHREKVECRALIASNYVNKITHSMTIVIATLRPAQSRIELDILVPSLGNSWEITTRHDPCTEEWQKEERK